MPRAKSKSHAKKRAARRVVGGISIGFGLFFFLGGATASKDGVPSSTIEASLFAGLIMIIVGFLIFLLAGE